MVTAATFKGFVAALHARPGLSEADNYRGLISNAAGEPSA